MSAGNPDQKVLCLCCFFFPDQCKIKHSESPHSVHVNIARTNSVGCIAATISSVWCQVRRFTQQCWSGGLARTFDHHSHYRRMKAHEASSACTGLTASGGERSGRSVKDLATETSQASLFACQSTSIPSDFQVGRESFPRQAR